MKTTILQLLTGLAIVTTAHAAPLLNIATVISEKQANGKSQVLASPRFIVESGKQASIKTNDIELALTPTLLADGSVHIKSVLKAGKFVGAPEITVALGKQAQIQSDAIKLTVTPSFDPAN